MSDTINQLLADGHLFALVSLQMNFPLIYCCTSVLETGSAIDVDRSSKDWQKKNDLDLLGDLDSRFLRIRPFWVSKN